MFSISSGVDEVNGSVQLDVLGVMDCQVRCLHAHLCDRADCLVLCAYWRCCHSECNPPDCALLLYVPVCHLHAVLLLPDISVLQERWATSGMMLSYN